MDPEREFRPVRTYWGHGDDRYYCLRTNMILKISMPWYETSSNWWSHSSPLWDRVNIKRLSLRVIIAIMIEMTHPHSHLETYLYNGLFCHCYVRWIVHVGTINLRPQLVFLQTHPWHSKRGSGSLETTLFHDLQSYLAFSQNSIFCTNGAIPFLSLGGHPKKVPRGHMVQFHALLWIQKSSIFDLIRLSKSK